MHRRKWSSNRSWFCGRKFCLQKIPDTFLSMWRLYKLKTCCFVLLVLQSMHLHFSLGWTLGIHCSALVQMGRAFGWAPIGVGKCNALLISILKANRNPLSLLNIGVSYKHLFLAIREQNYIAGCVNPSAKWKNASNHQIENKGRWTHETATP